MKRGTLVPFRLDPYATAMTLDDRFTYRQSDTRSWIFIAPVKTLEYLENASMPARLDTNPITYLDVAANHAYRFLQLV